MEQRPIGFFDSGLGGISVLAEALRFLPAENFVYYGDHLHVPYGDKSPEEVCRLTRQAVDKLLALNCKAIVLACNSATSVAAAILRQELTVPVVGIEPALKPASELEGSGDVLVMATHMTLSQPKFQQLMQRYGRDAIPVPCSGLMEYVEAGELSGDPLMNHLSALLSPYLFRPVKAVVLGCTHYAFLRNAIRSFVGPNIPLIDGNRGTAMQLKRVLKQKELLSQDEIHQGTAIFLTSAMNQNETIAQMEKMLQLAFQEKNKWKETAKRQH